MTIPAPFALVNVDYNRDQEYALLLEETVAQAVLQYGPNASLYGTELTGLVGATTYTATVTTDSGPSPISFLGSAAQTFATLLTEIQTDLDAGAADCTVTLEGNTLVFTNNSTVGAGTFVTVTDTGANPLFASIKKSGSGGFGLEANVSTNGNNRYLRWDKMDGGTQSNVDFAVDDFLAAAVANTNTKWSSGYDSFTVGAVLIGDDTSLDLDTAWDINVNVDGAGNVNVVLDLRIPQKPAFASFARVVDALNIAMAAQGVPAVASFVPGAPSAIVITANSVGTSSTVALAAGTSNDLIAGLTGVPVVGAAGVDGATNVTFPVTKASVMWNNWNEVLQNWPSPTGFGALHSTGSAMVFEKEETPPSRGAAIETAVYWDGSAWKYFENDATLGATVNPPEA